MRNSGYLPVTNLPDFARKAPRSTAGLSHVRQGMSAKKAMLAGETASPYLFGSLENLVVADAAMSRVAALMMT